MGDYNDTPAPVLNRRRPSESEDDEDDAYNADNYYGNGGPRHMAPGRNDSDLGINGIDDGGYACAEDGAATGGNLSLELNPDGWARLQPTGPAMTAMLHALGVRGLRAEQCYDMPLAVAKRGMVCGLVMLYKWQPDRGDKVKWNTSHAIENDTNASMHERIKMTNQLVNSGAVTQAFIAAMLNMDATLLNVKRNCGDSIDLGSCLSILAAYTAPMTPLVRGAAICSSQKIRDAHNIAAALHRPSATRPDIPPETELANWIWTFGLYLKDWNPTAPDNAFYLDGCASDPVYLNKNAEDRSDPSPFYASHFNSWLDHTTEHLNEQIKTLRSHRVPFELYAIVEDPLPEDDALKHSVANGNFGRVKRGKGSANGGSVGSGDGFDVYGKERNGNANLIAKRRKKETSPERERAVATHNYETFVVEMMKLMASRGDLNVIVEQSCSSAPRNAPRPQQNGNRSSGTASE
jgi:Ubiquitin carboxyl-terminal hydrolase, family 1